MRLIGRKDAFQKSTLDSLENVIQAHGGLESFKKKKSVSTNRAANIIIAFLVDLGNSDYLERLKTERLRDSDAKAINRDLFVQEERTEKVINEDMNTLINYSNQRHVDESLVDHIFELHKMINKFKKKSLNPGDVKNLDEEIHPPERPSTKSIKEALIKHIEQYRFLDAMKSTKTICEND